MFYVLVIWLCVCVCVVTVEFLLFFFQEQFTPLMANFLFPTLSIHPGFSKMGLLWRNGLVLGLVFGLLGYVIEYHKKPIHRLYLHFQKIYPWYYQKIPADFREISIVLHMVFITVLLVSGTCIGLQFHWTLNLFLLVAFLSFFLGLSIPVILRYRTTQLLDRPEKPAQALIHKLHPNFPLSISLTIGQIYLRLLLPLFSIFLILIFPLMSEVIVMNAFQYGLLLFGLLGGLSTAWFFQNTSHLAPELFIHNLKHLTLLVSLSVGFVLFGINSENLVVLLISSTFSGFLTGSY